MPSTTSRALLAAFTLLFWMTAEVTASPKSPWTISIFEGPAPPPEKGPPIALHALRNGSYLPAQIASIVAAYVLSLLVIGSALLFVGRRLRRAAQASPKTLAMEMMKPGKNNLPKAIDTLSPATTTPKSRFGPSPADTFDMKNNWPSPIKSRRGSSTWGSTTKGHKKRQPSVQSSVISFDESVIADDKDKNEREMERLYAAVVQHDEIKAASVTELPGHGIMQHPPELQHLRDVRPQNPTSRPVDSDGPARPTTKSPRSTHRPTPISLHSRNSSRSSLGSFSRKHGGIRSLPISPPMGSPDLVPDQMYSEAEPLTPRIYDNPGPPPPTPPQQKAYFSRDNRNYDHPVRTPRTPGPPTPSVQSIPEIHFPETQHQREQPAGRRAPAPLALRTDSSISVNRAQANKPLHTAPLPLRNPYPTNINHDRLEPSIKATVLETRPHGQTLRTPHTGVPATPYSPYMPFTPLTPMTPSRLVTRTERKRREKEEGRRVVTAEDAVIEEDDTWGNAYK